MRRALSTIVGLTAVGCGFALSVEGTGPGALDGGDQGTSSGTSLSSSSSGASGQSGSGGAPEDASSSSSGGSDPIDSDASPDAAQCQPLLELNGSFCGGDAQCVRAENGANRVLLPTDKMNVSLPGCNAGAKINGGHVQLAPALPTAFRVQAHFTIKRNQAPIVVLLLGAPAPDSLEGSACGSLQGGDVVVALYREKVAEVSRWKLQAQTTCTLPDSAEALGPAAKDTTFDLTLTYDGTQLTATGKATDDAGALDLASAPIESVALTGNAKLAFAAYALDDTMASRNSVEVDKLHVLCR